jgi:hypothetical protein
MPDFNPLEWVGAGTLLVLFLGCIFAIVGPLVDAWGEKRDAEVLDRIKAEEHRRNLLRWEASDRG